MMTTATGPRRTQPTRQRFYAQFAAARAALLGAADGVPTSLQEEWADAVLHRVLLLLFLQTRGCLDGDSFVLHRHLAEAPPGRFYRDVLHPLLFGDPARAGYDAAVARLLGALWPSDEAEGATGAVVVENKAFAPLFALFEQYEWQIDERAPAQTATLTPQVLGALLERRIDQKPLGAYYTAQDVTDYIATCTIIPALWDQVRATCGAALDAVLAELVRRDPDRYIFPALRHGADHALPEAIACGVAQVNQRAGWCAAAPPTHGLPGEIWREVVARRQRYAETRARLAQGAVGSINDGITLNLDLRQLACDAINAADAQTALAWQRALEGIAVLDPTCGAGEFLLAALDLLAPLAAASAERLESLGLERAAPHDHTAIVANNLYGVDLLDEAVTVCRQRLLLRLLARDSSATLPDLAGQIRRGDALSSVAPGDDAFHWRTAFPAVLRRGGFDAIIGNPPYVEHCTSAPSTHTADYATAACGNLYALVLERALGLLRNGGRLGMIVPIASVSTSAMEPLQALYQQTTHWHSHFAVRPGKLFSGVDMNLTITLLHTTKGPRQSFSTGYRRWSNRGPGERAHLFSTLAYVAQLPHIRAANPFPKHGSPLEWQMLERMLGHGRRLRHYTAADGVSVFYHSGGRYWRKALLVKLSSHYKALRVQAECVPVVFTLLNSQLFYWFWIANSNCMDVVAREVLELPVFALETADGPAFAVAAQRLLALYETNRSTRARRGARISVDELNFDMRRAKPAIDAIDTLLAAHYGFDDEQLDFILNYDIKYRCGPCGVSHNDRTYAVG